MTQPRNKREVQKIRGPLNGLISDHMVRENIENLQEFADRYAIGRTTLYELIRGREESRGVWKQPTLDTMVKLARALKRPLHELIYYIEPEAYGSELVSHMPAMQKVGVARAGWLGAGPEQNEEINDVIWVEEEFARGKDLVAFRIRGDSMAAGRHPIYDGDTVIVNRLDRGYNNAQVVARLTNDGHVCKLLKEDKFSHVVRLASANPEHLNGTPTTVPPQDIAEIIGRVVRVIHDSDSTDPASARDAYTAAAD